MLSKPGFAAKTISTKRDWQHLVLPPKTLQQVTDIQNWLMNKQAAIPGGDKRTKQKPGYRALFYGPPGTGKTLAATLLAKESGKEVFRVDLSKVDSKYIGETEKNLEKIFEQATKKGWILFFDEADALFGKRTDIKDSHDKYANQDVAYLIQRMEDHPGLIILAANLKSNIDPAFVRRLNALVNFQTPTG